MSVLQVREPPTIYSLERLRRWALQFKWMILSTVRSNRLNSHDIDWSQVCSLHLDKTDAVQSWWALGDHAPLKPMITIFCVVGFSLIVDVGKLGEGAFGHGGLPCGPMDPCDSYSKPYIFHRLESHSLMSSLFCFSIVDQSWGPLGLAHGRPSIGGGVGQSPSGPVNPSLVCGYLHVHALQKVHVFLFRIF